MQDHQTEALYNNNNNNNEHYYVDCQSLPFIITLSC